MKNKKLLYGLFVILVAVVVGLLVLGTPSPATEGKIVISYSGGNAMLAQECMDNSFITETADYIIEGSVEKVGSGLWEGGRIFTYTDLVIEKYVKGMNYKTKQEKTCPQRMIRKTYPVLFSK